MHTSRHLSLLASAALALGLAHLVDAASSSKAIVVDGKSFALNGDNVSYRFHVDDTGDLINDHFGGPVTEDSIIAPVGPVQGWVDLIGRVQREFPDRGRGDFRVPAVQIRQTAGYTVSEFIYQSHDVVEGKPPLAGLPSTFGDSGDVSTLVVHMYDNYSSVAADLTYSVFPKYDAIVRSVNITNKGEGNITVERLASLSVDLPFEDLNMLELKGDWEREGMRVQRKIDYGTQGFGSSTGYSSHLHNPFLALISPTTTESNGDSYGFSLVYTGSFSAEVEKGSQGLTRAMIGLNPYQLAWPLGPGESLTTPECVSVYSDAGVGGMSRKYHRLYRNHLMKSKYATETRPPLLNSWEGLGFDYNDTTIYHLAQESARLGVKLFVLDDGWFGVKYPRIIDNAGLGDWQPNPDRFPNGLTPLITNVTHLKAANTSTDLRFGLWFEPEMVNPNSTLYHKHPDWALHAGQYPRTLTRNQLVLNVGLPEVQDFIVESLSKILDNSPIAYVKWDNNRGIHEAPSPNTDHQYMLGLYKVFERLTTKFPDVIWEGCASGGGRFDPGVLHYFPQIWASDDTDPVERIKIQFGESLVYPPSAMGAHIAPVPSGNSGRTTPIAYRGHVAMMGGAFGLELNPADLTEDDRAQLPGLIKLAETVNPIVVKGDMWRLQLPEESNWPAALFMSEDGSEGVLFYFQIAPTLNSAWPLVRLQGLDPSAKYLVDGNTTLSGATLMNTGVSYAFSGEYDSKVIFIKKQ